MCLFLSCMPVGLGAGCPLQTEEQLLLKKELRKRRRNGGGRIVGVE